MDYSSYYQNNPQAYQFLGLPTPGHANPPVTSEDYSNSPTVRAASFHYVPPVQVVQHLPHPQSEEFHQNPSPHYSHSRSLSHSHSHSHSHYPHYNSHRSSPVSPVQHSPFYEHSPVHAATPQAQAFLTPRGQDAYEQFQSYDFNPHFGAAQQTTSSLPKSATPISQHGASIQSNTSSLNGSNSLNSYEVTKFETGTLNGMESIPDDGKRSAGQGQSNSDDDDMTPAQSRRKAQNRAAQRAFRERKERHVKDLEAKLLALETQSKSLSSENERLKLQLQKASTENEILKATSSASHRRSTSPPIASGPLHYSPTDFYSEVLQSHENKTPSHRIVVSEGGERLLAAGAAWDYIISHPLFLRGLVDVGDVSERLKSLARCDGQGPVFEEAAIVKAIELSVASGSDELL